MRITKKILSLLLVVSMLASFLAMTGFEASAALTGQKKTDFGIHFDDTTRKLKVLQLPDIQSSVSEGGDEITQRTKDTIRLLMQRYQPDVILLTGDQTQGGSTSSLSKWKDTLDEVFKTFTPYMKGNCKIIAVPGNHEYDFGSLNSQYDYYIDSKDAIDWDNNFSTIDLDGAPGAGNVTVSASSTNKAVAFNFALINSKGDEEDGMLRPGGENEEAYQQIVNWYTQMNNTLAGSQYSYKAQVTGQSSAYVPTLASQHVILQEILTTGAVIPGDATNGVPRSDRYTHIVSSPYVRLDPANNPTGAMNEFPCPTWMYKGATADLYNAIHNPGNCIGMVFGHDHDNWFDVIDDNGFRFIMGGALTQENYNTDKNPKGRYFEFTLDDATGDVSMFTEVKSYSQLTTTSLADVDEDRIEVLNGDGNQFAHTLSTPKTVYVGSSANLDPRASQEFGNSVQAQLLDYKTKTAYDQDLAVKYCLPSGSTNVNFTAIRSSGTAASIEDLGSETTSEGTLYKKKIKPESTLEAGERINFTVTYTYNGEKYEIHNVSYVESIKMPAGFSTWVRGWRERNQDKHLVDLAYVATLSGDGAYSTARALGGSSSNNYWFNTYYRYTMMFSDPDATEAFANHSNDATGRERYSMFQWSPSRYEVTEGHVAQRPIVDGAAARTDIYLDASALQPVSATDPRLDTGVSIDFWVSKNLDRSFSEYVAGIGFYEGDHGFNPSGQTIASGDSYANYNDAVTGENGSTGGNPDAGGSADQAYIFFYDSYADQQKLWGLGTTHVNGNLLAENRIGNTIGEYRGYPLVIDNKQAALDLNNKGMTMYTGVRNKGSSDGGYRILLYDVAPYYLYFHTYDKGALRELTMGELMNPRKRSDYPNASDELWSKYIMAYESALASYAQAKVEQASVDSAHDALYGAIAALLDSTKVADSNLELKGDYGFGSISVPPILYVAETDGNTSNGPDIQTSKPYTDLAITFTVPDKATNVKVTVINNDSAESTNSAVKVSGSLSGTKWEGKVDSGHATAGGAVYYKLTFEMPEDKNKDGKNDEYQQYAASYVRATTFYQGIWKMRMVTQNDRDNNDRRINTHIYYDELIDASPALSVRGASAVVALYPVQGTDSFSEAVNYPTSSNVSEGYLAGGGGDEGWAVGTITAKDYGNQTNYVSWREADKVMFYNDRGRAEVSRNGHRYVYWAGLQNSGGSSAEYIVAHYYYNKQAVTSSTKLKTNITITHKGNGDWKSANKYITAEHTGYESWNLSIGSYYGTSQAGSPDPYGNSGGKIQYESQDFSKNLTASGQTATGVMQNAFDLTSVAVEGSALNKRGYIEAAGFHQRYKYIAGYEQWLQTRDQISHFVSTGVAFKYNAVDRAEAKNYISNITNKDVYGYNKADMDPAWWNDWRNECFDAYVAWGNLWGSDFDSTRIKELNTNPKYKLADYTKLVAAVNKATNQSLVANTGTNEAPSSGANESITDYSALRFTVNSNDDARYAGNTYDKTMFVNNAADLIKVIQERTTYAYSGNANDALGTVEENHLDFRYQTIVDDYAEMIEEAYARLRLAPADYTEFDKYANCYDKNADTILFVYEMQAGYNHDDTVRKYAKDKELASGIFTSASRNAFVNAVNIDRTLKKPSEEAVVTVYKKNSDGVYEATNEKLPRLYPDPDGYTFKYPTASSDKTDCLYNKARDAYEDLEFRRAGEYYQANGQWTDSNGVTYYANYNKTDRGSSYVYTPVFSTSYNQLSADIANGGYAVTDNKVKGTYTKGNSDTGVWVTNGAGENITQLKLWTDASWGTTTVYGFSHAYENNILGVGSTYQQTKANSSTWILALYVENQILPDIASVDYYYEKLVPASYNLTYYEAQKTVYALYELGGDNYDAVMALLANNGYVPCDAQGNEITGGAAWYEATSWNEYLTSKEILPNIIEGATLEENQEAINLATQTIHQKRAALKHKLITELTVKDSEGKVKTFASILEDMNAKRAEIENVKVDVFGLRGNDEDVVTPKTYAQATQNGASQGPLFVKHNYFKDSYVDALNGKIAVVNGFTEKDAEGKDKGLAPYLEQYFAAVNDFTTLYNDSANPEYINKANTYYLEILLNKDWIPPYDKYGSMNAKPTGGWFLGEEFDGSSWYTEASWNNYVAARNNAISFFGNPGATEGATAFDGYKVFTGTYYGTSSQPMLDKYTVTSQGAKFNIDLDSTSPTYGQPIAVDGSDLTGSINKATYDLVVAYYKLEYKKVSDFEGDISDLTGGYDSINTQLNALILEKENEKVTVVIIDENGNLAEVERTVYDPAAVAQARDLVNKIIAMADKDLGENYIDYVNKVNECKTLINSLAESPVYLDGWNGIINHLNENAGDTVTISDSGTMTAYFNAVYTGFNPATIYAANGQSINNIFSTKAMYDSFAGMTAQMGQTQYNVLVTNLYNELNAASFVPAQVTMAAMNATTKLSQSSKAAYDPLQLNGRDKVTNTTKYSADSVNAATAVVTAATANKITLWNTDPTVTGYNDGAGTVIDGTIADGIWAAVGLVSDSGAKDYDGADRDDRYLLVEGGQFLEALEDAIEYAKGELYEADGVTVKKFDVVKGDGTFVDPKPSLYTDESVQELVDALARAVVTDETTQDQIDQMVFNILDNTDIDNTIKLKTTAGGFYGELTQVGEDDGLKYKPADYSYLTTELKTPFDAKSEGAQVIVNEVWVDENGDGIYELNIKKGPIYFTEATWKPYYDKYSDATNPEILPQNLTAKDQDKINSYTTGIYQTRNALAWEQLDDGTLESIQNVRDQIDSLKTSTITINTYQNSVVTVGEDGKRDISRPSIGEIKISPYGDITEILDLWDKFNAEYVNGDEIDITQQAELLKSLKEITDLIGNLETKKFNLDENNEFTIGVRNLVDSFIAGEYDYTGLGDGIGVYTADYLAIADTTNISEEEKDIRDAQRKEIEAKLDAIYTVLGTEAQVGAPYTYHSTDSIVQYETAADAINALTEDLYEYLTETPAQYAGFAMDIRQGMYDFFSTEITVDVSTLIAENETVYTVKVPLFDEVALEDAMYEIDGRNGVFSDEDCWPTINQLDESVGIELNETVHVDELKDIHVAYEIMEVINGYSELYSYAIARQRYLNEPHTAALDWLTGTAVYEDNDNIYILASPANGLNKIDGVEFAYSMNVNPDSMDGDWYTNGYGNTIEGSVYYRAVTESAVTGSSYGGWFTDATYKAVLDQIDASDDCIKDYAGKKYGKGLNAEDAMDEIEDNAGNNDVCWDADNRNAYVAAIKKDQKEIDKATALMYEAICSLQLLSATDAYREVATLIYEALGFIPTWNDDNTTDIIIDSDLVGETVPNPNGGRVFNYDLLSDLDDPSTPEQDYKIETDANGNVSYYSTKLPTSYDGGAEDVEYILNTVFADELVSKYTIDKANLVNGDSNSVKSRIIAELEKLTLGTADLSAITSLVQAFLYNNPSNAESLGSYKTDDNGVGEEFFTVTHETLGTTGNAFIYRNDKLMKGAGSAFHASGFYDFTKYTDASLRAVIKFLGDNDIINGTVQAIANNFNITNKTGFDIEFEPGTDGDTLYKTPATQQAMIDEIYKQLVDLINALELRKATTTKLVEAIGSGDSIMVDEALYDHEALDADNKNIWEEFTQALANANSYVDVTVINEVQVIEAEDRLEKAIKALVLYVDTFAPVLTIHNTQTDLNKFYEEHKEELGNTISSADKMVTASYMTPNLGGYTLYVYTNQSNPSIVVSLKDTTSALNTDGSQRTVSVSKPEKMSVSAQAMNGVTANVIAPVHNAETGMALSSELVTLTGTKTVSTQTAKNAAGGYDADSSAYLILSPQFNADAKGTQQAAVYTIDATDSAVTKNADTGELSDSANGAASFDYASSDVVNETEEGKITVFVYYLNSMPADGKDNGVNADGSVNGSAILTYREHNKITAGTWTNTYGLVRTFHSAVKNWEFSDPTAKLAEGAAYVDPTFGENNFGSFVYKLDPNATSGLDYVVAKEYFENGAEAAKAKFIEVLNSNSEYIATFAAGMSNADKFMPYGAGDNYNKHLAFIDNGTLMFAHVADRFGNVCNRIIQVEKYDQLNPVLTADGAGKATITEPGGSGIAKVDLFNYMGTQGSSLYIDYLFKMLHVDDFTYVSEDNTFTISTGAANAGKLFTVAVTDRAGNVGSVPVNADANGDIVLTAVETYENVVKYEADTKNVDVNTGEDLEVIEFVFNSNETIKLNFIEPSSIVKAGPDGNVFANKKNMPLNIVVKSGVEAIKLYNVDNGTEEIWTADNATVKDNGDGTSTWTVKYTFTEGTHNYTATAKVDGEWEITPVAFSFVATTKSVEVKLIVAGIGKIRFGYNEGSYSNVPVMSKKTVPYGSVVTLEAVQTEVGSDFYYWTNNSSNRIISASTAYQFTAVTNMDLTAQFTTNECFTNDKKLVVYVNNAENLVENFELAEGEDYTVPAAPSLPEHVFKKWSMTKEEILASDEKMIIVRPVYSLVVKNTVTLTEGNWTTTGAGVYESVDNDRALVSISASATNDAGASFLYWLDAETGDIASYNRSYTFHAIKDTELTPVYGDASAVVPVPVARISTAKYDKDAKKVNFYAERSIPAGYELLQTGIIVTKTASVGTDEDAFVLGASGVGKGLSNSTAANGYYAGAVSATAGTVVYARAYVIYQNADGDIFTDYSSIASYNA